MFGVQVHLSTKRCTPGLKPMSATKNRMNPNRGGTMQQPGTRFNAFSATGAELIRHVTAQSQGIPTQILHTQKIPSPAARPELSVNNGFGFELVQDCGLTEQMVSQNKRDHGFHSSHGARQNAGIV